MSPQSSLFLRAMRVPRIAVMRGLNAMRVLRTTERVVEDEGLAGDAKDEERRFASWVDRVGEARAREALSIAREKTGSTTLPELLVEAALRRTGADYRTQVDLGWARPDFVVFTREHDQYGVIVLRVQGEYWHKDRTSYDAAQADRLARYTVFGLPVLRVEDIWEKDIYAGDAAVMRVLRLDRIPPVLTPANP